MSDRRLLLASLMFLVFSACAGGGPGPTAPPGAPRDVVRTLDAELAVGDVERGVERLRAEATRLGGGLTHARVSRGGDGAASIELRVPTARLGELRRVLRATGDVLDETEEATDVTGQRADADARLRNAEAAEERLRALLERAPSTVADVLAVERELTVTRERIERLRAERDTLSARVELARVTVSVERKRPPLWSEPGAAIASAFHTGLTTTATLLVAAGCTIAALSPAAALLVALTACVLGAVRLGRRRRALVRA